MKPARAFLHRPRVPGAGTAALILGGIGLAGCYINDAGLSPPTDSFYYPTGLVVSPGGKVLYVANSDFDLQYNGGTVQALDLTRLRDEALKLQEAFALGHGAAEACKSSGLSTNPDSVLYPGPCAPFASAPFIERTAIVGAFASGLLLTHRPVPEESGTNARLFVPVRGDPSVTFFDVGDDDLSAERRASGVSPCSGDGCFALDCGASRSGERCSSSHRIGEDPTDGNRGLKLPLEPVGIAADSRGEKLVVAHQTEGRASLILNDWEQPKPALEYVRSSLPPGPTELASVPPPRLIQKLQEKHERDQSPLVPDYQPGFLLTFRASAQLDLLRVGPSGKDDRQFLTVASALGIGTVANGTDSRGVAIDSSERTACENGCGEGDLSCLAACVDIPLRMYIAHRSPSSLLVGEVRTTLVERENPATPEDKWASAFETMTIRDAVPLAVGASRVALGHVVGRGGALELRVFAVAFDSGIAFSYDPKARQIDARIDTGRGPHAIAFDTSDGTREGENGEPYSFMYVAHFTDSYIGVVDLDMNKPNTFGSMIMTLGKPVPPRGSQ
jgi:hypothetical protein